MHIVNTDAFRACAEAIANLRPDYIEGRVTSCQVKVLIGEMLDVWPASIFEGEVAGDELGAAVYSKEIQMNTTRDEAEFIDELNNPVEVEYEGSIYKALYVIDGENIRISTDVLPDGKRHSFFAPHDQSAPLDLARRLLLDRVRKVSA